MKPYSFGKSRMSEVLWEYVKIWIHKVVNEVPILKRTAVRDSFKN